MAQHFDIAVGPLLSLPVRIGGTDPALRDTLSQVSNDPAEEMAAIASSYAATMVIGVPISRLFHTAYKDSSGYLIAAFARGSFIGLPMLQY